MDMKTKIIITAMLLTTAYVLLVNLMFLSGFGKDEMVKVGWYSEFGGNSTTTLYPLYVWLNFPYTVCFYFFTTLFFAKVKVHVNKWLGETAFVLWCVSLVPILVNTVYDLYMVSSLTEMKCTVLWRIIGKRKASLIILLCGFCFRPV